MRRAFAQGMALRITLEENAETMVLKLEGRLAGPWVAELDRLWTQTSPEQGGRKLALDLRQMTYADAQGIEILRTIYRETRADLLTGTPWTQYLAEEVKRKETEQHEEV
jgi:hypothetical protein